MYVKISSDAVGHFLQALICHQCLLVKPASNWMGKSRPWGIMSDFWYYAIYWGKSLFMCQVDSNYIFPRRYLLMRIQLLIGFEFRIIQYLITIRLTADCSWCNWSYWLDVENIPWRVCTLLLCFVLLWLSWVSSDLSNFVVFSGIGAIIILANENEANVEDRGCPDLIQTPPKARQTTTMCNILGVNCISYSSIFLCSAWH